LIEEFSQESRSETVLRLAALPRQPVEERLLRRGIPPESVPETLEVLDEEGTPFSAVALVRDTFAPKYKHPTPFPPRRRFSDGNAPVYYAALEERTCVEEVKYHLSSSLQPGRYFAVISCQFDGLVLLLCGHEKKYPDLTSKTESGYPFCQRLANEARLKVKAIHAPSARAASGTCVPVFDEHTLSNHQTAYFGRFVSGASAGDLVFQRV
jgi:hypothetical protein